ncbi:MAG TPA: YbhB/YbcL family Raf kinase inhibitor-like protein [Bryobacteraceae bacterium]|nr:YbhB/YbcL family Raf kinase inhibitor-like protein [Bryobacteraceae bacterium]
MRMKLAGSLAIAAALCVGNALAQGEKGGKKGGPPAMRLTSPAFADGSVIPDKYTQAGESISPELDWTNVPPGTQSFVLLFHDPDVALQRKTDDVTHWIVWNIPATATKLEEGIKEGEKLPDGMIQGKNTRGTHAYMGPGAGAAGPEHHYTFELFALDTTLDLSPDATRAEVMNAMQGHILGKAVWEGRFHRH